MDTLSQTATGSVTRKRIPLEDFFRNAEVTDFTVSPDGAWLAFLRPWNDRQNVYVRPVAGGEERRLTAVKDRDIGEIAWKGNHTILYARDFGGDENFRLLAVDVETGKERDLTPFENVRASMVDALTEQSESEILVEMNQRDPTVMDLVRLDVRTGAMTTVAENPGNIIGWACDNDGVVRIAIQSDGARTTVLHRDRDDEEFRPLVRCELGDSFVPLHFTSDNSLVYAASNVGRNRKALVLFDPSSAEERSVLYEHPTFDVTMAGFSERRHAPTLAGVEGARIELHFLDDTTRERYDAIRQHLPDVDAFGVGNDRAENLWVVRSVSDRSLGAYYLWDDAARQLTKLGETSPWLKREELAPVRPISFTSRDGLTIRGYLTLPLDAPTSRLPVVINPHGGPWARDSWFFNPEVQFLANRGYAVLQINFRGSTGFGKEFLKASYGEWGLSMQDDISDGVAWLIEQGIADPKRIAIYGGSYGGYATLAGLTFTPGLYACGIDYVGISNLFTFLETIPPYWEPLREMMYAMIGHPGKDRERLEATSPVFHVDRITAPLLVVQGAQDPRVNINESNQIVEALRGRGIEVEYMVRENEGHGFHNQENRFDVYRAMERFLEELLGPA